MSEATLREFLSALVPHLGAQKVTRVLEGMALAAYQAQEEFPVLDLLVCDAAGQFVWLTAEWALCWIHDSRHYAKLMPRLTAHEKALTDFQKAYWAFYN
jgi:hypothetical protein